MIKKRKEARKANRETKERKKKDRRNKRDVKMRELGIKEETGKDRIRE